MPGIQRKPTVSVFYIVFRLLSVSFLPFAAFSPCLYVHMNCGEETVNRLKNPSEINSSIYSAFP